MQHFIKWTLHTVYLVVPALLLLAYFSDAMFAAKPLPVAVWAFVAYFRGKALVDAIRRFFDASAKPKIERAPDGAIRSWVLKTSSFRLAFDFGKAEFTLDAPRRSTWSDRGYFEPDVETEHGAGFRKTLPISGLDRAGSPYKIVRLETKPFDWENIRIRSPSYEEQFAEYRNLRLYWIDLVPGKGKEGRDCPVWRSYTDRLAARLRPYFDFDGSKASSGKPVDHDCRVPTSPMDRPQQTRFDVGVEIRLLDNDPAVMAIFNPRSPGWIELNDALEACKERTRSAMARQG